MKGKILLAALFAGLVLAACTKSTFNTTPTLTFKGINGNEFVANQLVNFQFEVTDKEGDLQDTIFVERTGTGCPDLNGVIPYEMPNSAEKANLKAQVDLTFVVRNPNPPYIQLAGCSERNDTTVFRFWIKDLAGHVSDTVKAPPIVLLK